MDAEGWCLVLALWGEGYGVAEVNRLARDARRLGPDCRAVVLFTDRRREGLDPEIQTRDFPAFFARPECFGWGYIAKLAVFSRAALPAGMACVYLDLDSVVTGDLGRLAAELRAPDEVLMLPPGNLIGFGPLRRLVWRLSGGRRFAVGNSSIMVWNPAAAPDLAERYRALHAEVGTGPRHMQIDDVFISWAAQGRLRGVPRRLGVSFRREFLSRLAVVTWARRVLPQVRRRRAGIVAVTFNGPGVKPARLSALPEGARIEDGRGRAGVWSAADMGPLWARLRAGAG
jgi:hypothetical protein